MAEHPVEQMLRTIAAECRLTKQFTGQSEIRPRVIEAMRQVPREQFVPPSMRAAAYDNTPLPIGKAQTISQPFIVALMTDLLHPEKDHKILEIGAGSGYQAAVLSLLVKQLYTIEIIPSLAAEAAERLARLGYDNVAVHQGDGYQGFPEQAQFDSIIVTAAADRIPPPLKEQLKPGGRLVIPVGHPYMPQQLLLLMKNNEDAFTTHEILPVAFVPLTGAVERL
ncbi:protein-L-isoaspartate(D-aspartate) O-methyltransferase [Desulfogranum marinum]|uniref:protein-L-isoaspartate(D-aspartate) O-methyltransferase n=1 Tax=Desulfogranum marinum TaxID=453220 RepID=UPI0019625FCE|nr:protein-L-isoaspartate(D-aspartate) O-methyltransferase [Desulfogranum marinum]MBM9511527.1 protein-L-isoaspartate(D-aspartate) O-methyltransferase [Desulfogranum marinum]